MLRPGRPVIDAPSDPTGYTWTLTDGSVATVTGVSALTTYVDVSVVSQDGRVLLTTRRADQVRAHGTTDSLTT